MKLDSQLARLAALVNECCEVIEALASEVPPSDLARALGPLREIVERFPSRHPADPGFSSPPLSSDSLSEVENRKAVDQVRESFLLELEQVKAELHRIHRSRGWRALGLYWSLVDALRDVRRLFKQQHVFPVSNQEGVLKYGVDNPVPESVRVGKGTALVVRGWCYHTTQPITRLDIVLGKISEPVRAYGLPRSDVFHAASLIEDPDGLRLRSGFWTILRVPAVASNDLVTLKLSATLRDSTVCEGTIGSLRIAASES